MNETYTVGMKKVSGWWKASAIVASLAFTGLLIAFILQQSNSRMHRDISRSLERQLEDNGIKPDIRYKRSE